MTSNRLLNFNSNNSLRLSLDKLEKLDQPDHSQYDPSDIDTVKKIVDHELKK